MSRGKTVGISLSGTLSTVLQPPYRRCSIHRKNSVGGEENYGMSDG